MRGFAYVDSRVLPASRKHPNGRIRHYVYAEVDGRKKTEGAFDDLASANRRVADLQWQIEKGVYGRIEKASQASTVKAPLLFGEYHSEWWEGKGPSLRQSSRQQYQGSYRRFILPVFSGMLLDEITPGHVQKFVASDLKGLSPGYARTVYSHLRVMLHAAEKRGVIVKSPCRDIDLPELYWKRLVYLEPSEIRHLIDVMDWPYKALFAILGMSGIRVGEGLALRVGDINLQRNEMTIDEAWDINEREFHQPKTRAGFRKLGLLFPLVVILKQYFEGYPIKGTDTLLFPSPTDSERPVSYNTIFGIFKRNLVRAELPDVTIHSERHSFASGMIDEGVSIVTLARYLGHSSPDITFRVYAHEIRENLGEDLARVGKLYEAPAEPQIQNLREITVSAIHR